MLHFLLLSLFHLLLSVDAKQVTQFDGFCTPEILYKPYVKYYRGRDDARRGTPPFVTHPPGFWNDFLGAKHLENTYICINGLAWMYYKITTASGFVTYHAPELHSFVHHCMLVNNLRGPGATATDPNRQLMGLLLVGNAKDYRRPSIQLFTAPTQQLQVKGGGGDIELEPVPGAHATTNVSSLLIVGDTTECILQKGRRERTEIRIRTGDLKDGNKLSEADLQTLGYAGSFCKLSYPHFPSNVEFDKSLKEDEKRDFVSYGLKVLNANEQIRLKGCFLPDNYTTATHQIVSARLKQIKDMKDPKKDEIWDSDSRNYFDKAGRLKSDLPMVKGTTLTIDQFYPQDACSKKLDAVVLLAPCTASSGCPADCDPTATTKPCHPCDPKTIADFVKHHLDNIKEATKMTDVVAKDDAIKKETGGILQRRMAPCVTNAFHSHKDLLATHSLAEGKWTEIERKAKEVLDKVVEPSVLTPLVSKGESLRLQLKQAKEKTKKDFETLVEKFRIAEAGGDPGCVVESSVEKSDVITILRADTKEGYLQLGSPEDPTLYPSDAAAAKSKTCAMLPRPIETCSKAKPDKIRSCKLMKARMNDFAIPCDPAADSTCTKGTRQKDFRAEDAWRKDVMNLLEDIYFTATSSVIKREFSITVNRMMRAYLTDFVIGTLPASQSSSGRRKRAATTAKPNVITKTTTTTKPKSIGRTATTPTKAGVKVATKPTTKPTTKTTTKVTTKPTTKATTTKQPVPANDTTKLSFSGRSFPEPTGITALKSKAPGTKTAFTTNPCVPPEGSTTTSTSTPAPSSKSRRRRSFLELYINPKDILIRRQRQVRLGKSASAADPCSPVATTNPAAVNLPPRRETWDELLAALEVCKKNRKVLKFKRHLVDDVQVFYLVDNENKTEHALEPISEQADVELGFNFVIDSFWRIFATVLGLCMPSYETKIASISSKFYSHFSEDFLLPLRNEWTNRRDNAILSRVMGEFYRKSGDLWSSRVLEAAFVGQEEYRPLRKLLVNGGSEMNFFASGPFKGTRGMYT